MPDVHIGCLRSVATAPGREVTRNARLYAAAVAAMNEAEIATSDRAGCRRGAAGRHADATGISLCALHTGGGHPTVIRADAGGSPAVNLSTTSNTLRGVTRRWTSTEDVVQEVSMARIWAGVHYRASTEVGNRMGVQVGALVARAYGLG